MLVTNCYRDDNVNEDEANVKNSISSEAGETAGGSVITNKKTNKTRRILDDNEEEEEELENEKVVEQEEQGGKSEPKSKKDSNNTAPKKRGRPKKDLSAAGGIKSKGKEPPASQKKIDQSKTPAVQQMSKAAVSESISAANKEIKKLEQDDVKKDIIDREERNESESGESDSHVDVKDGGTEPCVETTVFYSELVPPPRLTGIC